VIAASGSAKLPLIDPRHGVVAFDARGHGGSDYEPEAFSSTVDAVAVMDAAGLDRAVLIGCSTGGRVAVDVALERPHRVRALVLVAAPIMGPSRRYRGSWGRSRPPPRIRVIRPKKVTP